MVLIVLSVLFFLLILGFLLIPIELYIDTGSNDYYVQLKGLARASLEGHEEELLRIRLRTLFRNFYFYPLRGTASSRTKKIGKSKPKKPKKRGSRFGFRKVLRLLKSFKVKKLWIDVDTGDCLLNAKLYPVFAFLNYRTGHFNINFEGRNHMVMYMQNRPIDILKSFINL